MVTKVHLEALDIPAVISEKVKGSVESSKDLFEELADKLILPVREVIVQWGNETTVMAVPKDMRCRVDFTGFGIGYRGAGTKGLAWLLGECNVVFTESELYQSSLGTSGMLVFTPTHVPALFRKM